MREFWGKYRGKITGNKDPLHLGRVQVTVPAVFGEGRASWALPCTPYAGKDIGLFMVPPLATNIWVEFEGGDPDYPIWSGCFWGDRELPSQARVEEPVKVQVFRTKGATLTVSTEEKTKGIALAVEKPMVEKPLKLVYNPDGIELNHSDNMTVKVLSQSEIIELKNGDRTTVTLSKDSIQLKESNIEIKLTNNSIELKCNPAEMKLSTSSGIELKNAPAKVALSSSGIELASTPAGVKIGAAGVDANSGGLGSIKVSLASVNVNSGALEVT
ncbi:MAG: phage baseplate assembly protein V [Phormidesmis sp.]